MLRVPGLRVCLCPRARLTECSVERATLGCSVECATLAPGVACSRQLQPRSAGGVRPRAQGSGRGSGSSGGSGPAGEQRLKCRGHPPRLHARAQARAPLRGPPAGCSCFVPLLLRFLRKSLHGPAMWLKHIVACRGPAQAPIVAPRIVFIRAPAGTRSGPIAGARHRAASSWAARPASAWHGHAAPPSAGSPTRPGRALCLRFLWGRAQQAPRTCCRTGCRTLCRGGEGCLWPSGNGGWRVRRGPRRSRSPGLPLRSVVGCRPLAVLAEQQERATRGARQRQQRCLVEQQQRGRGHPHPDPTGVRVGSGWPLCWQGGHGAPSGLYSGRCVSPP